ncbi:hypothetical protein E4U42_000148 [Claviceps africana]|uniref:Uncharacterized protein n=1 Tax=Claviceps africana TaxID=83212 RepID=A0A8K0NEB6_9HYPO|nr:hypothetical protein E4U42_000148 [Claviceps africana]
MPIQRPRSTTIAKSKCESRKGLQAPPNPSTQRTQTSQQRPSPCSADESIKASPNGHDMTLAA